jgi:hypothetical protein
MPRFGRDIGLWLRLSKKCLRTGGSAKRLLLRLTAKPPVESVDARPPSSFNALVEQSVGLDRRHGSRRATGNLVDGSSSGCAADYLLVRPVRAILVDIVCKETGLNQDSS